MSTRLPRIMIAAVALSATACGGSASDSAASQTGGAATEESAERIEPADTLDDTLATSAEPDATAPATTPTTPPPETTTSNIPPEPVTLRQGIMLTSGWSYVTKTFDRPFEFTIPTEVDGRFRIFLDSQWYVAALLNVSPRNPDVRGDQQPGVIISTVPSDVGVDQLVETMTAFADGRDDFDLTKDTGLLRGEQVTILRGSANVEGDRTFVIPTSEESSTIMAEGSREFIMYIIDVEGHPVIAALDADPLQFDLIVKNGLDILESIDFS